MNMFKAFEARIAQAFGASLQGAPLPFSFRRLAKRAAREMEQETYVVDGVDTAPSLFTILVSEDDDLFMRRAYGSLCEEISSFVEAEAAAKGYVFAGKPLARFMVDQTMRQGSFDVFADNVDPVTLEKIRLEEQAFLAGIESGVNADRYVDPYAAHAANADQQPRPLVADPTEVDAAQFAGVQQVQDDASGDVQAPQAASGEVYPYVATDEDDSLVGLSVLPVSFDAGLQELGSIAGAVPEIPELAQVVPAQDSVVMPAWLADEDPQDELEPVQQPAHAGEPIPQHAAPAAEPVPQRVAPTAASAPLSDPDLTIPASQAGVPLEAAASCRLVDRETGVGYVAHAPKTHIGRGREQGGIVLDDPNISRHHAELLFDGGYWRIHDLGSTNGTLVNGVDVETQVLQDGDLITLGLLTFEFRGQA